MSKRSTPMRQSKGFEFKQFYVHHDQCAMKVGTDGVLLGAWAPVPLAQDDTPLRILDIGTGSGLIALMLAQRCPEAQIDAIDIDGEAVAQAAANFTLSPWSGRLHATLSELQQWSITACRTNSHLPSYNLIVSNPPYFENSLKNPDNRRSMARHTDTLCYDELICHSAQLLTQDGVLALIVPADAEHEVLALGGQNGLYTLRVTRVYSKENKPPKRTLLAFSRHPELSPLTDTLVLEDAGGGRSAAYRQLTKDFYL